MITKIQSYSSAYNAYSANKAMNKNSVKNSATSFSGKKIHMQAMNLQIQLRG